MLIHSVDKDCPCCYLILCSGNGKVYIGSTVNYKNRIKSGHLIPLKKGIHPNLHLQRAWNQYGPMAFIARPLVWLSRDKKTLLDMEGKLILAYGASNHERGFNICVDPEHSTAGIALSEEHREKFRQAKLGKKRGPYGPRAKETKPRKSKGSKLSEEHKQKMSKSLKGKNVGPKTEEAKEKMRLEALKRWEDPAQREHQAENLKKQKEEDPQFASRAGKIGNQIRWGNKNQEINNSHEGEV